MNIFIIIFYLFCYVSPLTAFFDYDQAVSAAQNNNWESANQLLTEVVVNKPDNPSVLYDAGIAAFNVKNFSQAYAYFEHAAQSQKAPMELKEQAYFNLGNTQVELKQLEQAIASYEKVLEINPNNERAKHNLEVVKKMLEQQKQQQQQEKQQQEKDKKEKEKEQQKQDQQQQETSDQDESGSGQGSDSQEQQEGNNEQQQGDKGKQKKEKNNKGSQPKESKGQQEQPQEKKQDKGQQEKAQQQAARNDNVPDNNKGNEQPQPAGGKEKQQGNQELKTTKNSGKSGDEKKEAWLAQLLQENEQEDAQLNKQMMKAMVGNQLAGRDGQNCW